MAINPGLNTYTPYSTRACAAKGGTNPAPAPASDSSNTPPTPPFARRCMCSSSRLPRLDDALELCLDLAAAADSLPAPMMTSNAAPASTSPSAGSQVAWGWVSLADTFLVLCGGARVACVGRSLSAACMLTSTPLAPTEGFFFACRGA